jgi:hypothetical protein
VPERLARFVPDEWPGVTLGERVKAWREACADWLAADSERQPRPDADESFNRWWLAGGSRRRLPFGEYGNAIDVIREGRRQRRAGGR